MSKQTVNYGSSAGDDTGEVLFTAFQKVVANFNEIYNWGGNGSALTTLDDVAFSGDSDDLTEGSTNLLMTTAERSKLSTVASGATANSDESIIDLIGGTLSNGTYVEFTFTDATDTIAVELSAGAITSLGLADSAVQPGDLGAVATSNDYDDLDNKPTIPNAPDDTAYNAATWNGVTDVAPSKNATRDQFEALDAAKADASHTHAASDITSGTLADARIAQSNVTQHEAALDATNLINGPAEANATADQTGAEIESLLDTELSNTRWKVGELPSGGTTGQVLKKTDGTDYNVEWDDESGGGGGLTQEQVEDLIGDIVGGTGVDVTYVAATGTTTIDLDSSTQSTLGAAIVDGDFSTNGLMKRTGAGAYATATEGTDYSAPGGTDIAVADGGTGASTAAGARSNLGVNTDVALIEVFRGDEDVETGDGAGDVRFIVPPKWNEWDITNVRGYHVTAGTGAGSDTTDVQIHNVTDSVDILSTKLTIDEDEKSSDISATAAVINTSNDELATGDELRFDVDDLVTGTAPKGLYIVITVTE